jgi:predicted transcriptional regulator
MKQDDSVETPFDDITALTAKITAEYLRGNRLPATGISEVISLVHDALRQLGRPAVPEKEPQRPAVPIRKSVTAEYIVCLEDGRKLKMLKRHLRSTYGMTPGRVPGEVEPAGGLSHGGSCLCRETQRVRQVDWSRQEAVRTRA